MTRPDDLLMLLEAARYRSFAAVGAALGIEHTTVSRRITALERDLGGPVVIRTPGGCTLTDLGLDLLESAERIERTMADVNRRATSPHDPPSSLTGLVRVAAPEGFGSCFVAPLAARLHRAHRKLRIEVVTATRPLVQGVGSDIEVGVGHPASPRVRTHLLTPYALGLYATDDYLAAAGHPQSREDLAGHSLVYYVDSLLRVDDLDLLDRFLSGGTPDIGSTSVYAQLEATVAGGGIGVLPHFLAVRRPTLRRVLADQVDIALQFRVALAPRALRRPAASAVLQMLQQEVAERRHELLPA